MTKSKWRSTTILSIRKGSAVIVAGDGQVSVGQTIMKSKAKKVRRLHQDRVLAGFAGSTETYNQYGPGISLSRPITAKLSSSLGYQLYWRDSNLAGRNYTVNVVSLNLSYTF